MILRILNYFNQLQEKAVLPLFEGTQDFLAGTRGAGVRSNEIEVQSFSKNQAQSNMPNGPLG